ncbi:MAG: T9SS type A sorting domain-containing protein [Fibrobacteria bacterium]|nr:T9SS type A sorting domain-containing protein [Fibrobacteria bacterium]
MSSAVLFEIHHSHPYLEFGKTLEQVRLYNLSGKIIDTQYGQTRMLAPENNGMYFIEVTHKGKHQVKKIFLMQHDIRHGFF